MISSLYSTGYSNSTYSSQSPYGQGASDIIDPSTRRSGSDIVTISGIGRQASLLGGILSSNSGPITLESIEGSLKNDTSMVEEQLRVLYSKQGISPNTEMDMSVGRDGKIIVSGNSSKADKLEDAINSDPELSNTIRRMSANTSFLEAANKHQEFAKRYETNPDVALKEFAYLLEQGRNCNVTFTMNNGSISSEVEQV
jgi:hypothetical protein